jgi:hypothetical protein
MRTYGCYCHPSTYAEPLNHLTPEYNRSCETTLEELGGTLLREIENQQWKKTNYLEAHEYILRVWNPELFDNISELIDKEGYKGTFLKTIYSYLNIGDYRYWHYTLILNRADNRVPSRYFKRL